MGKQHSSDRNRTRDNKTSLFILTQNYPPWFPKQINFAIQLSTTRHTQTYVPPACKCLENDFNPHAGGWSLWIPKAVKFILLEIVSLDRLFIFSVPSEISFLLLLLKSKFSKFYSRSPASNFSKNWNWRFFCANSDLNLSAPACYVFVTPDLETWFSLNSSGLILLNFVTNSYFFLLFQNIYVLFWNDAWWSDKTWVDDFSGLIWERQIWKIDPCCRYGIPDTMIGNINQEFVRKTIFNSFW